MSMLRKHKLFVVALVVALSLGMASIVSAREIVIWAGADLIVGAEELVKEIKRQHPELEPVFQPMSADDVHSKLLTHIAAGMVPDIVAINEANVSNFATLGALLPLDPYFNNDPDVSAEDWVPMVFNTGKVEGTLYALPLTTDVRGLFWNKTMFADAGLDPEVQPYTWSELEQYSRRLTKFDGEGNLTQVGFRPYESQGSLYCYALLNGAEFLSEDGRTALLDQPEVIDALAFVNNIYEYTGGYAATTSFGNGDRFLNQQVAMRVNGNWRLNTKAADARAEYLDWGIGWVPVPDERYTQEGRFAAHTQFATWSVGWRWVIPADTKNADDAWKVLKILASYDGHTANAKGEYLAKQAQGQMYVPRLTAHIESDRQLATEYLLTLPSRYLQAQWFFIEMLDVTVHRPNHPLQGRLVSELSAAQYESTRDGVPPSEALENAQRRLQAAIDQYYAGQ